MDGSKRDNAALAGGVVATSNNYLPLNGSAHGAAAPDQRVLRLVRDILSRRQGRRAAT